jgi:hypothetical protein
MKIDQFRKQGANSPPLEDLTTNRINNPADTSRVKSRDPVGNLAEYGLNSQEISVPGSRRDLSEQAGILVARISSNWDRSTIHWEWFHNACHNSSESAPPLAFEAAIEPLFLLVSEFEDRKTRFFMRERLLRRSDIG